MENFTANAAFHDLKGKSVFISGGGAGIGAYLTSGFLAQGAKVAFVQRSDASAFADEMEALHGVRPLAMQCDVTDIPALQACIAQAAEENGPIGVLINNAANDRRHTIAETSVEEWDAAMNVNLRHHFFAAQAVAPMMRSLGGGSIINYSSISYMMGNADYPAYATAKSAITGLTRAMARELGPDRIRVNAIMPGWTLTQKQLDMWVTEEGLAGHMARQCLPDHEKPEDLIEPTLFLASDTSRMITSQAIVVDGGVAVTG